MAHLLHRLLGKGVHLHAPPFSRLRAPLVVKRDMIRGVYDLVSEPDREVYARVTAIKGSIVELALAPEALGALRALLARVVDWHDPESCKLGALGDCGPCAEILWSLSIIDRARGEHGLNR